MESSAGIIRISGADPANPARFPVFVYVDGQLRFLDVQRRPFLIHRTGQDNALLNAGPEWFPNLVVSGTQEGKLENADPPGAGVVRRPNCPLGNTKCSPAAAR